MLYHNRSRQPILITRETIDYKNKKINSQFFVYSNFESLLFQFPLINELSIIYTKHDSVFERRYVFIT
jgi:hypothetical protein